jgi:hypothetical protein
VISPKVYVPLAIAFVACLLLLILTGDKSYLIALLVSLTAGGAGVAVKPAPEVTQREVNELSRRKRGLIR